ncbi:MAG: response regulator transcription factor [Actinobacteria bacterium]|nr:response regulator transcription factor [Actinomycetota bacterium]
MTKGIPLSVLIIDDHQVVREGLRTALIREGYLVVGEAASRDEGFAQIAHKNPDIIIVDLHLPDGSGLEIVEWARKISSRIGIVVLTLSSTDEHLIAALHAGASAYVLKSAPLTEVLSAVLHSSTSPLTFSGEGLSQALKHESELFGLTPRELEVLALLPSKGTSANIATILFVTEATIKSHLASIYRKLSVANRTEAVVAGIKNGLIS